MRTHSTICVWDAGVEILPLRHDTLLLFPWATEKSRSYRGRTLAPDLDRTIY